jgi:germination protein M
VARVSAIGGATLHALLDGPLPGERAGGLVSAIPDSVILLGLGIESGTATVDLSTEFGGAGPEADLRARVAQLLYTLTQFSTVKRVAFEVDGAAVAVPDGDGVSQTRPVRRDDYLSLLPDIFVETPRWGETTLAPIRLTGSSNVFEATFLAEVLDASGATLLKKQIMATCGSGCWGTFDERLPLTVDHAQAGKLVVYTLSAADGSVENPRTYAIELDPHE